MKTQQANKSEILANIKNLMKKTEIECSEEQYDKLATLVELLAKWNNALNLTAIREIDWKGPMIMLGFITVVIIGLVVIFVVKRLYNRQRDQEKDSNYRQYQLSKLLAEFDELLAEHDYKNHQLWK